MAVGALEYQKEELEKIADEATTDIESNFESDFHRYQVATLL